MTLFLGQRIAIMGLGKSGTATARHLLGAGAEVFAWDDQDSSRAAAAAEGITLRDFLSTGLDDIDMLVWSPGIPHSHPAPHPVAALAKARGLRLVCDIELLFRANPAARYIAITGTNGKSTTTSLIAHLLQSAGHRVAVGGNLGIPALALDSLDADGIYVLEISSYQAELLDQARFDVALLLNITPDHLARHGGMAGYAAAKASLFDRLRPQGTAIVGVDDAPSRAIYDKIVGGHRTVAISAESAVTNGVSAADGWLHDGAQAMDLTQLPRLPGRHNWQNACAAYATARCFDLPADVIAAGLASFGGLAHRQELVAVIDGVRYVNDSKATNADAVEKALVCYDAIYWILGGQAKEGGIASLVRHFPRIRHAYLIGEAAEAFATTLGAAVPHELCGTLDRAVQRAQADASRDRSDAPVVLLSPACASWDQFRSFEHRGEQFRVLVERLPGQRSAA